MKIGLFAGTFDPIHNGHLAFAQKAVQEAELDKVVIVAEKNPYRKKPHAQWDHRQSMIEHATESDTFADHDYEFSNQLAHKHTMIDFLNVAQKHYGNEHEFWFLVGADTFEHMHKWRDVAATHVYGGFVVALRDEQTMEWLESKIKTLKDIGMHVQYKVVPNMYGSISSSKVRTQVQNGGIVSDISPAVASYMQAHKLYI